MRVDDQLLKQGLLKGNYATEEDIKEAEKYVKRTEPPSPTIF